MRSSAIFLVSVVTSTRSSPLGALTDLADQVVDLALRRLDHDLRVDEPGRPDDLFDELASGLTQLIRSRCGRQVHRLADPVGELLPGQRPVVDRRR